MEWFPPDSFEVEYRATGFPPEVPSSGTLRFSSDDLAHALFVTGRAPGDEYKHGEASVWEWLHRSSQIPAYIRCDSHARLRRSRLASELDRSEIGGLSYALGQAMTGIFCGSRLGVSRLMHVDRYADCHGVVHRGTRRRADLFGLGRHGWVVAEAKGRSRPIARSLRNELAAQTRSISTIEGEPPWLAAGCVASFSTSMNAMRLDVFGFTEDAEDSIRLEVDLDRYTLAYYLPFLNALDLGVRERDGGLFEVVRFDGLGLRLGVLGEIVDRVRRAVNGELTGMYRTVDNMLAYSNLPAGIERNFVRFESGEDGTDRPPDGTFVETSWDEVISTPDWEG